MGPEVDVMGPGETVMRKWFKRHSKGHSNPEADSRLAGARAGNKTREDYGLRDLTAACMFLADVEPGADYMEKALCSDNHQRGSNCGCKTCHFCRQKTITTKAVCSNCGDAWCTPCLYGRHGENRYDIGPGQRFPDWWCPACRNICNCSGATCQRRPRGWGVTSQLVAEATKLRYRSVALYLILTAMRPEPVTLEQLEAAIKVVQTRPGHDAARQRWLEEREHRDQAAKQALFLRPGVEDRPKGTRADRNMNALQSQTQRAAGLLQRVQDELPVQDDLQATDRLKALGLGIMNEVEDTTAQEDEDDMATLMGRATLPATQRGTGGVGVTPVPFGITPAPAVQQQGQAWQAGGQVQGQGGGGLPRAGAARPGPDQVVLPLWPQGALEQAADAVPLLGAGSGQLRQQAAGAGRPAVPRVSPAPGLDFDQDLPMQDMEDMSGADHVPGTPHGAMDHARGDGGQGVSGGGNAQHFAAHGAQQGPQGAWAPMQQNLVRNAGELQHTWPVQGHGSSGVLQEQRPNVPGGPLPGGGAPLVPPVPRSVLGVQVRPGAATGSGSKRNAPTDGTPTLGHEPLIRQEFLPHPQAGPQQAPGAGGNWQQPHTRMTKQAAAGFRSGPSGLQALLGRNGVGDEVDGPAAKRARQALGEGSGRQQLMTETRYVRPHVRNLPAPRADDADADLYAQREQDADQAVLGPMAHMPGPAAPQAMHAGMHQHHQPAAVLPQAMDGQPAIAGPAGAAAPGTQAGAAGGVPAAQVEQDIYTEEDIYTVFRPNGNEHELGFYASLLAQAEKEVSACRVLQQDAALTAEEKTHIEAAKQMVLCDSVWDRVREDAEQLPVALFINETPDLSKAMDQELHRQFLHTCDHMRSALALLCLIIKEVQDEQIVESAYRRVFNLDLFIKFEMCDAGARAVLAKHGLLAIRTLCERRLPLAEALGGLARWITCLAEEHTQLVALLDLGLHPSQAVDVGFLQLPASAAPSDALSAALAGTGRGPRDPRTDKVEHYAQAVTELLRRMMLKCQELCPALGAEAQQLLHPPGLAMLIHPLKQVDKFIRQDALMTVVAILQAAKPQTLPGRAQSPEELQQQGLSLANALSCQVLVPLELLCSVDLPQRQQPETWWPGTHPAGQQQQQQAPVLAGLLPSAGAHQELLQAGMRPEVKQRRVNTQSVLGPLPRWLLGLCYGTQLWAGRLSWQATLQQLLVCGRAGEGELYAQPVQPLRRFAAVTLAAVVQHMQWSPPRPADVACQLPPCVLRLWLLTLLDHGCRHEVPLLSEKLAAMNEVVHIIGSAHQELVANPALAEALGALPDTQGQGQTSPEGAVGLVPARQQPLGIQQLRDLWHTDLLSADSLGRVRASGMACLLIGSRPTDGKLTELLADVDKMWGLGKKELHPGSAAFNPHIVVWQSAMTVITLRLLRVTLALRRGSPAGTALQGSVQQLTDTCCKELVASAVQLWKHCSGMGSHMSASASSAISFSDLVKRSALSHLQLCLTVLLATVQVADMAEPNQNQGQRNTWQAAAQPKPHVRVYEVVCLATCLPHYPDLPPLNAAGQATPNQPSSAVPPRGGDGHLLQQHVATCLLNAMFVPLEYPAALPVGAMATPAHAARVRCSDPSLPAWHALQWLLRRPVHDLVTSVLTSHLSRSVRQEEEALATLRLVRLMLSDDRLTTCTALSWVLPPLMSTTLGAPQQLTPSCHVMTAVYQLWQQLLPHLAAHRLLHMPETTQGTNWRSSFRCWEGPLPLHELQATVGQTVKVLCCQALGSALEVIDRSRTGPAAQRLTTLCQQHPAAWQHKDILVATGIVKATLGQPMTRNDDALKRARTNAGGPLAMGGVVDLPGDKAFLLLEAQLDFIAALASTAEATGSHMWAARVLPGLHAVLRCGQENTAPLDDRIAVRLQGLVELEASGRRVAVQHQPEADVLRQALPLSLWQVPLTLSQVLDQDVGWSGWMVALLDRQTTPGVAKNKQLTWLLHLRQPELSAGVWALHKIRLMFQNTENVSRAVSELERRQPLYNWKDGSNQSPRPDQLVVVGIRRAHLVEVTLDSGVKERIIKCSSVEFDPPDAMGLVSALKAAAIRIMLGNQPGALGQPGPGQPQHQHQQAPQQSQARQVRGGQAQQLPAGQQQQGVQPRQQQSAQSAQQRGSSQGQGQSSAPRGPHITQHLPEGTAASTQPYNMEASRATR